MLDPYTVRRLLPRMVAAAILIQLSWYLTKFAIDIFNDIGRGLAQLMYYPFTGGGNIQITDALTEITPQGQAALTLSVIFAGAILAFTGFGVMGIILLAVPTALALIIGYFVLLLRQILIILCVILAPIALVLWVMPGTERYWNLWKDNFIKLLMMFPLIVGLIAAGRIFGLISGQTLNGFVAFIAVLVGFFGPLLILPKTFGWGGQLMGMMGNAAINGTRGLRGKPADFARSNAAENRKYRALARSERLADNPNNRRFADRLLAGEFNVLKQRGRGGRLGAREMAFAQTLSEGEKLARENVPAQLLRSGYDSWRHGPAVNERGERIVEGEAGYEINKLDALQTWAEGREYAGVAPSAALSGHSLDTLFQLGDPDRVRMARQSGHIDPQVWSKALARNFGKANETARYLTLAPDLSTLTAGQMLTQDDDTAQELERQLAGSYIHNRETGLNIDRTPEEHREQLQRAGQLAVDAIGNSQMWDNLSVEKKRVLRSAHTMAVEAGIDLPEMVDPRETRQRQQRGHGQAEESPEPAPEPPTGPGHEEEEGEIRIDR